MSVFKDNKTNKWTSKFRYRTWDGNFKQKKKIGFKTKKQAQKWEREFSEKLAGSSHMTLSSLIELYLEDCKARLKPTTLENKKYLINTKINNRLGNLPIDEITPLVIRNWQTEIKKCGYKPTYEKIINNQISAIFNYACRFYSLKDNPCHKAGSMGKKQAELKTFWTQSDFNQFIKAFDKESPEKIAFSLLFYSGMRCGELLALTYNDFDFNRNTISINKSYARIKGEDYISPPKTPKSKRTINMPIFIMNEVKEYKNKRYDYKNNERLFLFNKSSLTRAMKLGIKISKVKECSIHYLRHAHASYLIEKGFSPNLVSERLGHERIETTLQTYSHLYPNKQEQVAKIIQESHEML